MHNVIPFLSYSSLFFKLCLNLNTLDFYLRRHLKLVVYKTPVNSVSTCHAYIEAKDGYFEKFL